MDRPRFRWLHTWTKWESIQSGHHYRATDENGERLPPGDPPCVIGYWERQRRECQCCGKRQLRKVAA
jgi:hypothetical protein